LALKAVTLLPQKLLTADTILLRAVLNAGLSMRYAWRQQSNAYG
jgi:hypothetical protein